jgi:CRP/FNR family cyclic AMP-dependent transcriptional regulator
MTVSTLLIAICCLVFLTWWKARLRDAEHMSMTLLDGLEQAESKVRGRGVVHDVSRVRISARAETSVGSSVRTGFDNVGGNPTVERRETSYARQSAHPIGAVEKSLRNMWLFSELNPAELSLLAQITRRRRFDAGEVIMRQGDRDAADMYGVLKGILKVTTRGSGGQEILINLMQVGDLFGEVAFLDRQHRSATVTSLDAGELLVIPCAEFDALLNQSPKVSRAMLAAQARLVRSLTERAEDKAFLDVRVRLAKRLVALADYFGTPLGPREIALQVALSQRDLGDMVQAKRASVSKCLREWAKQGLIERSGGRLVILDRERLQDVAAGAA